MRSKTCSTPRDLRYALAEADASFKPTMQARGTDRVALSNGRGQIAGSPTVKRLNALNFHIISDLAPSYPTRPLLDCCGVSTGLFDLLEAALSGIFLGSSASLQVEVHVSAG